ncbi:DNA repair protein [Grosmannia clavigera kw1407]|uniref:Postreplication repair E3 ubiquitin-protein ligase RAD18 n=1 Tax=Grosmannia clavigera (strain kw1407 / UAMH 11150) TaxID=655863 RepID=F0XES2_GROCL|nr:DNA repair protein [Grosmannia clavigera kw1407]EFX03812.1 DNA repair protein [Grosmannia clavigera kw1407]
MDSSADVADSTDWLGTSLACLAPVEQALRCHVCKDFYNSPMITSCNHTFCSLCIRRSLSADGKCPLCRMADQESKLRGNWALREVIEAFCKARTTVLGVAQRPTSPPARPTSLQPKRKAEEAGEAGADEGSSSGDGPHTKRTRTSARLSKAKAAETVASMPEDEVIEIMSPEDAGDGDMDYEPDDGLAACPICWTRMKPWQVDRHIDTSCTGSPQKVKAISKTTAAAAAAGGANTRFGNPFSAVSTPAPPPPERIPSLSYSLLTDTALRKKLASMGLSTAGTRQLLERRHKEWLTIWNANCDSARPKRKAELQHDLDVWERTIGSSIGGGGSSNMGGRGSVLASRSVAVASQQVARIRDKNFDSADWSTKHNTSFKDLIANARQSRSRAEGPKKTEAIPDDGLVLTSTEAEASVDEAKPQTTEDGSMGAMPEQHQNQLEREADELQSRHRP